MKILQMALAYFAGGDTYAGTTPCKVVRGIISGNQIRFEIISDEPQPYQGFYEGIFSLPYPVPDTLYSGLRCAYGAVFFAIAVGTWGIIYHFR
jgi:hypothetical protein